MVILLPDLKDLLKKTQISNLRRKKILSIWCLQNVELTDFSFKSKKISLFGKKSRFGDLKTFWVPWRKVVFPFFHEAFGEIGQFWEPNETTHEINSYERANSPLSDGAKQNSVQSIVFLLWFFESFFIFPHFCGFPKTEELSLFELWNNPRW